MQLLFAGDVFQQGKLICSALTGALLWSTTKFDTTYSAHDNLPGTACT